MRACDWNDVFGFPDAALAGGKRIPKTVLVQQALLTKTEQKVLDKIGALTHFATVQKSTTRIPPTVNDERDIQGIVFLRCEMAGASQAVAEVAHLLHKCFPNPTVVLQEAGGRKCISVAVTRKSLSEKGATVVERVESTGLFDTDVEALQPFIDCLSFDRLPQADLYTYLNEMADDVMLARAVDTLGFYPVVGPDKRGEIIVRTNRYDALQSEIRSLKEERRSPDVTLNDSAKLRMKMRKAENERDAVLNEIRELCCEHH